MPVKLLIFQSRGQHILAHKQECVSAACNLSIGESPEYLYKDRQVDISWAGYSQCCLWHLCAFTGQRVRYLVKLCLMMALNPFLINVCSMEFSYQGCEQFSPAGRILLSFCEEVFTNRFSEMEHVKSLWWKKAYWCRTELFRKWVVNTLHSNQFVRIYFRTRLLLNNELVMNY